MASGGLRGSGDDLVNIGRLTLIPEKLLVTVMNRCLSALKNLNFRSVMIHIQQKGLFDKVTIDDIENERTETKKILHLIDQIAQSNQDTYQKFKECLTLANQEDLKILLEEVEENLSKEMKEKQEDDPSLGLPTYILDVVPSEDQLNQLSMEIGKEYAQLGIELDVSLARIELITMENLRIPTRCFKILQEWVQRDNGQATFGNLEKACIKVGIDVSILNDIL